MDITQFHATFFEEAKDCLDAMESGLLALESGEADAETINTIFRSAHSIKGGAGTFGFQGVANFTHVLETLLDAMRSGRSPISPPAVATLLGATDVLRSLLRAAEHGGDFDAQALRSSESDLAALMQVDASSAPQKEDVVEKLIAGWQIGFKPAASMFMTGNDPLRILRELERLGPLQATCNADNLPSLNDLDPFEAHLAWDLRLEAPAPRDAVDEAFAWVLDECDLSIQEIQPPAAAIQEETAAASASAAATPAFGRRAEDSPTEGSIRVSISKIDALINLVGELVITQAMLKQLSDDLDPAQYEKLLNGMSHLDRNTRDMQDAVMNVRMLPMDSVFNRFPRVVRDISGKLNKLVRMKTVGEATELDKGVIEKIVDPLNHLVRNAVDHGLELPDVRRKAGKDETGTVTLRAMHQGGHVVIEVSDDGKGLDRGKILKKASDHGLSVSDSMTDSEVWQLVFHPGLSTADSVTDVSGRGVGMDVVKKNINSLGGQVEIASTPGAGSTVTIRLPLTLAILDGMSVSVGDEIFILPLASVLESLQPRLEDLKSVAGGGQLVYVRGEYVPMLLLHEVFGIADARTEPHEAILVLVESENKKLALLVDELVGQQQVVIKNLESNYKRVRGVSGATILGDGRVALIIDVGGLPKVMGATTDRKVVARQQ